MNSPFPFEDLYHRYADSWRVPQGESMLSACGDKELERDVPKRAFLAGDLEPKVRERALGVCTAAGVKQGPLLDACVLDVAVIGHDAAAKVFAGAVIPVAVGTIAGGTGSGIPSFVWWLLLLILLIVISGLLIRKAKATP